MDAAAVFPRAAMKAGMYESFYLRAVAPQAPVGVWIRHTVHKAPGRAPSGSVWCTVFNPAQGPPLMTKSTSAALSARAPSWISVGGEAEIGPARAQGHCGPVSWELAYTAEEAPLRHLTPDWLYRTPLPRTKLTSPAPAARFDGTVEIDGRAPLQLSGWRGMVGHNWGSEHAERWIWLHGIGFSEDPSAWLDVALGRIRVAGRMTPWIANGVLSLDGHRHRLGGIAARGLRVSENAAGADIELPGAGGVSLRVHARVPAGAAAGWRYADPDGGGHDVVNCSVAALELAVDGLGAGSRRLTSAHGGVYELGMREHDHGVELAPFDDG